VVALAFSAADIGAEEERVFYRYTDSVGQLHIVQSIDRVPAQYRNQLGEISISGDPEWIKTTAEKVSPRPPAKYEPVKRRASRGGSRVVLYYADWCGYCKKARRWLEEHDVSYDLRDVDISRYGDELRKASGSKSVPVLSVGGELIRGFDPAAYAEALGG